MRWIVVVMGLLLAFAARATVPFAVDRQFGDHVVLQRDAPMRVSGTATPGAKVRGMFDGVSARARADDAGRWTLQWPARAAGGPFEIALDAEGHAVVLRDVMVGDVWLASGQSNMEFFLREAADGAAESARGGNSAIREFKLPHDFSVTPRREPSGGKWRVATAANVGDFSAVAYYFASRIQAREQVPIGIINATWGGSRIEAWSDARTLGGAPEGLAERVAREDARVQAATQRIAEIAARAPDAATEARWSTREFDDRAWPTLRVPGIWEAQGYADMDGVAWYRAHVRLSAAQANGEARLNLGMIDDSDVTYVNGTRVGGMTLAWNQARDYAIAAGVLRVGDNVIAIRVEDTGGGGGLARAPEGLFLRGADGSRVVLPSPWRFMTARVRADVTRQLNLEPVGLNHAMIQPWRDTPLRGVIWYQGEADANTTDAPRYAERFSRLIAGWRETFGQPDLPFFWVQLANYGSQTDEQRDGVLIDSPWATVRAAQEATLRLANTGQALALDVGDSGDIHPRDKRTVGERLAREALRVAYGHDEIVAPTRATSVVRDGTRLRVRFTPGDAPVRAREGSAFGALEIAGADGVFHPARARVDGVELLIEAEAVTEPVAARYAWRDDPRGANLVDATGEPIGPFWLRVDSR